MEFTKKELEDIEKESAAIIKKWKAEGTYEKNMEEMRNNMTIAVNKMEAYKDLPEFVFSLEDSIAHNEERYKQNIMAYEYSPRFYYLESAKQYLENELSQRMQKIHKDYCKC